MERIRNRIFSVEKRTDSSPTRTGPGLPLSLRRRTSRRQREAQVLTPSNHRRHSKNHDVRELSREGSAERADAGGVRASFTRSPRAVASCATWISASWTSTPWRATGSSASAGGWASRASGTGHTTDEGFSATAALVRASLALASPGPPVDPRDVARVLDEIASLPSSRARTPSRSARTKTPRAPSTA